MSLWTIIAQVFGLVPQGIDAGKQIAEAIKPSVHISKNDATLWHTIEHRLDSTGAYLWCSRCQRTIPLNLATTLCDAAVDEREALYS
jgi:hypothetical protein